MLHKRTPGSLARYMVGLGSADQHLSEQYFARVLSSQPSKLGFYEDRRDYSCCIIIQIAWSADSLQSLFAFVTYVLLFHQEAACTCTQY